ncbi:MAG: hypothetical protein ABJG15_06060 [Hyphomonadaceae bacterium]
MRSFLILLVATGMGAAACAQSTSTGDVSETPEVPSEPPFIVLSADDKPLRLSEDQSRCVTAASETVPAGPRVKRPLQLETCDDIDASLKQWTVAAE